MTTFQLLDAFTQDLQIQSETETTREVTFVEDFSDDDQEVVSRRKKTGLKQTEFRRMVVHLFGKTADGKPVRANVEGFEPFFYVKLPFSTKETQRAFQQRVELMIRSSKDYSLKTKDGQIDVDITFCKRKVLFGYTGGMEYTFACLHVKSIAAWRTIRNYFLTKESRPSFELYKGQGALKVYEANLDPMLRFFHICKIQPCGWITIDDEGVEEIDGTLHINCDWKQISNCVKPPCAVAPFCVASWDIECYSENGEFPLPKKGYERIAKLLAQNAHDGKHGAFLLLQAALYPENPPPEMDPIRHINGKPADRKKLEELLNDPAFHSKLDECLEESDRDEKHKLILTHLKKSLGRLVPLAGDPVIQIGVVLQRGTEPVKKYIFVLGTCDAIDGAEVFAYKTEREMILGWAKAMREWNVDILMGYNIFGFDEKYLWGRAEELGITADENIQDLTRLCDTGKELVLDEKFLSSSALGDNTMYIWSAHGRLQVDLYNYVKRSYPLPSYKLDDVCQHFMSGNLSSVDCSDPSKTKWTLNTKTTSDVIPGRYVVLLDETGDALVDKLKVLEVKKGSALIVEAPTGDDADDLAISTASAIKWAVVKDDVSPQEIFKLHRSSSEGRARVGAYCIQDCVLVLDLYKKLDVFNNAMAMANACSVPVAYIFTRGQGVKIESLIFKECHERQQAIEVLPTPAQYGTQTTGDESYEGAIVLDPIPGFYFDSPVGVADFASLYPSTIISENISYDTLVWVKNFKLNGKFDSYAFGSEEDESFAGPDVRWTDITFDIWGSDPEDKRKHPAKIKTGIRICRYAQLPGNAKGALPDIVQKLLATRKAKRKEGEKEQDPFRKALLDAEQLAYKLTANSLYGQLGSGTFKIRLQHLAASVTAYGRKQILFAKAAIEKFYGPGSDPRCSAVTVYGDTDSLFINFNPKGPDGEKLVGKAALEATMHLTEEAGKFVTRCLKPPHDFEYDKVFSPFIIFSKKRYVGNKYEDSPDSYYQTSMGIATKRRDYAPIVKLIYGGALRILLTQKDIPAAIGFVKEKLKELVEGKMSLNMLTMSKSLRAEYASSSPPAHKVLAERIRARDPGNAPASGERVQFIYVLPLPGQTAAKLQGDRVETPAYIRAKNLKPDYRFYIEHQLMNPLVQLFALVVDKIPGVVQRAWSTDTDRELATSSALFKETLAICDRSAKNTFAEKFFGTTLISQIQTRSRTAVPGTEQPQTQQQVVKKPQQATINTYFVDKILVNAMDKSKKKNTSKKTSGNPTDV